MNLNQLISVRSFSNCKIAAILVHDAECIYLFKISCSITCLIPLSGPMNLPPPPPPPPPLLGWDMTSKIRHKGRYGKHSVKWWGMSKRGKGHKRLGVCGKSLKCKKLLCESKSKKKVHKLKKYKHQHFLNLDNNLSGF